MEVCNNRLIDTTSYCVEDRGHIRPGVPATQDNMHMDPTGYRWSDTRGQYPEVQHVGEPAQVTWTDEPTDDRGNVVSEVIDGRVSVYGEVIPAFTRQAQAISAVLDHEVQPWEVPLIMIAIKMIRTTEAPDYSDNSDDIEGYLDIFRQLMGKDMVEARSVKEYVAERERRSYL